MTIKKLVIGMLVLIIGLPVALALIVIGTIHVLDRTTVVLYTIHGGGHTWPGGKPLPEWIAGPTTRSIDAASVMWAFFREHRLSDKIAAVARVSEPAEEPFVRAYVVEGEVCFDSQHAIDWADVAAHHFAAFPLTSPDRALVASRWNEVTRRSTFRFSAPLPAAIPPAGYTLLAESGVHPLRASHLRGEVSYDLWEPGSSLSEPPSFSGAVCGALPPGVSDAGFVTTRTLAEDQVAVPTAQSLPPAEVGPSAVQAVRAFIDRANGTRYVLVRRQPDIECDGPCCQYSYDLFSDAPEGLSRVLSNAYSCDP